MLFVPSPENRPLRIQSSKLEHQQPNPAAPPLKAHHCLPLPAQTAPQPQMRSSRPSAVGSSSTIPIKATQAPDPISLPLSDCSNSSFGFSWVCLLRHLARLPRARSRGGRSTPSSAAGWPRRPSGACTTSMRSSSWLTTSPVCVLGWRSRLALIKPWRSSSWSVEPSCSLTFRCHIKDYQT